MIVFPGLVTAGKGLDSLRVLDYGSLEASVIYGMCFQGDFLFLVISQLEGELAGGWVCFAGG